MAPRSPDLTLHLRGAAPIPQIRVFSRARRGLDADSARSWLGFDADSTRIRHGSDESDMDSARIRRG
eukprot:4326972-Pyramimonas_sp.AAC.1